MKTVSIAFAAVALLTGLFAAWKWYQASRVEIDPGYIDPFASVQAASERFGMEMPRQMPSGDPDLQRINEIVATWDAMNKGAAMNKEAAAWTAVSVVASAIASFVGAF